jgi:2-dehydropantoate 2-reductase
MKIAVVGCGAVGSFYGAKLAYAGGDVHFLLRSDYDVVRRQGVFIRSPQGDFRARPGCARAPQEIGPVDLVLIGLKTIANDQFSKLLPPLVGANTAVLTLQNGLGNEEALAKLFPPAQIMGGLCFVCLNRIEPGVIHHMDHGQIVLGEFSGWPEPRTHEIASTFRDAGVPCKVTDNLAQSHWEKLVWNIPFNGLGVASCLGYELFGAANLPKTFKADPARCLTTDKLLADPRWEKLARELMLEVIHSAQAIALPVRDSLADKMIERTRTMGAYKPSTLLDFQHGLPIELNGLFLEPLRQAKAAGVDATILGRLCEILQRFAAE